MESNEKRKRIRVPYHTEIMIRQGDEDIRLSGDSVDLSQGGLFVRTSENVPMGAQCRVRLCLSGTVEPIELAMVGKVVRKDPSGVGLQFEEMDLDSYTLLKEIIRHNAADPDLVEPGSPLK